MFGHPVVEQDLSYDYLQGRWSFWQYSPRGYFDYFADKSECQVRLSTASLGINNIFFLFRLKRDCIQSSTFRINQKISVKIHKIPKISEIPNKKMWWPVIVNCRWQPIVYICTVVLVSRSQTDRGWGGDIWWKMIFILIASLTVMGCRGKNSLVLYSVLMSSYVVYSFRHLTH